jgi:asparagine synthase (glutamine-hydrolysing)
MCGIAGFVDLSGRAATAELEAIAQCMADAVWHRGPDDAGVWVDPEAGIALSHRRLSIIDVSPLGHQPMHSDSGRYILVFNGEIYNFRALRRELEESGHRFRGHSDTEVMLACIAEWGLPLALQRLNGMFAFALWDRQERRLHLVRDRLGEKPLYYGWVNRTFLFGSELKALRAHPAFRGEIDRGALALYARHNCIPAPYSIYQGVRKLPPATSLTLDPVDVGSMPAPIPYWSVRQAAERGLAEPFTGSASEATAQLDDLLRDAVRLRLESDVPLGAFLSGGVDSSTVVALMQAQCDRPVKTFTMGFHEASFNEAQHAKAIARHLGTDHTELYVTPAEAMAVIPRLPVMYDEPFADASQIPTFLLCELAKRHVTVSLSGDGGDELFGGYVRHLWGQRLSRGVSRLPRLLRRGIASALLSLAPETWDALYRPLARVLPRGLRQQSPGYNAHKLARVLTVDRPDALYLSLVSYWNEPGEVVLEAAEPRTVVTDPAQHAAISDAAAKMMYLDAATYLPDDVLVKVDRASMRVSLEARVPLLDHRIVEFAWRLPLAAKLHDGQGKWLLRQVLYQYVPPHLIERPKSGFGVPIGAWLRGPLREWAEDLLAADRLHRGGFLNPQRVRQTWSEHLAGRGNWEYQLWIILMFEAWLRQNGH